MLVGEDAKFEHPRLGLAFNRLCDEVSAQAPADDEKAFKTSPNDHLFQQICDSQAVDSANHRLGLTYSQVDIVGQPFVFVYNGHFSAADGGDKKHDCGQ